MWEMLTNKAKYGLRAMCALASLPQGERLQAHAIADRANVPGKFLETILVDLRRAGYVESHRGQLGGHSLAKPADAIMVGDLIRAIDIETGKTVWSDVLPAGGQANPMIYERNGRQYLVIVAAGGSVEE